MKTIVMVVAVAAMVMSGLAVTEAGADHEQYTPKGSMHGIPYSPPSVLDAMPMPPYEPLYEAPRQRYQDNPFLNGQYQRDQQIQDQERRLRNIERERATERFNRSMRPRW